MLTHVVELKGIHCSIENCPTFSKMMQNICLNGLNDNDWKVLNERCIENANVKIKNKHENCNS